MASITIENGEQKGVSARVGAGGEIRIGRGEDCELALRDTKAPRSHARVVAQGDAFLIEDLESTNGTRVNDRAVTRKILEDGDVIAIGQARIVFRKNDAPVAAAAPAAPRVPPNGPPAKAPPKLDLPPPKTPPKFDLPPPKVVKVKLEAGRGRMKKAEPEPRGRRPERPKRRRR